jgi:putative membrane protein
MTAWTLVFHILGLVLWIGGLLIVTNLQARQAEETSSEARAALGRMAMRLLNGMVNPGALLTVVSGVILIATNSSYYLRAAWLHSKLALVVVLIGLHGVVWSRSKRLVAGQSEFRRRDWMTLHGVIALIFVGILILVLPVQALWK